AVAEDGVGRRGFERFHEAIAYRAQVMINRRAVVVIEHEAFGADGGALDHLAGAAGDEVLDNVRAGEIGGQAETASLHISQALLSIEKGGGRLLPGADRG